MKRSDVPALSALSAKADGEPVGVECLDTSRSSNDGLIVTGSALATTHRDLIVELAMRHKLSAVYYEHLFVCDGGLIAYGPDLVDQYQRSAGYVDRILMGEKPAVL